MSSVFFLSFTMSLHLLEVVWRERDVNGRWLCEIMRDMCPPGSRHEPARLRGSSVAKSTVAVVRRIVDGVLR